MWKKFTSFCQVLKKGAHKNKIGSFFSASRCSSEKNGNVVYRLNFFSPTFVLGIHLPFHTLPIICISQTPFSRLCIITVSCVYVVFHFACSVSLAPFLMHRSRLMSNNWFIYLLTCLLTSTIFLGWLGSRVVSVLDSGAVGPGFKSQPRRCRVTVLGKLFTPIVPLFNKQQNW